MSHIEHNNPPLSTAQSAGRCKAVYLSGSPVASISVDAGGVIGDGHYGKDPLRAVMIASTLAYDKATQNGIALGAGALEENILVTFDPYTLPLGTRIHIGEVIVAIAQYGTICKSLTRIDTKLPKLLKGERGIFAQVVQSGTIHVGDPIWIESTQRTRPGEHSQDKS